MIQIQVTQRDIELGTEQCRRIPGSNGNSCPISHSIRRLKLGEVYLEVGAYIVQIDGVKYQLPEEAQKFVWMFDMGYKVEPFTFTI